MQLPLAITDMQGTSLFGGKRNWWDVAENRFVPAIIVGIYGEYSDKWVGMNNTQQLNLLNY